VVTPVQTLMVQEATPLQTRMVQEETQPREDTVVIPLQTLTVQEATPLQTRTVQEATNPREDTVVIPAQTLTDQATPTPTQPQAELSMALATTIRMGQATTIRTVQAIPEAQATMTTAPVTRRATLLLANSWRRPAVYSRMMVWLRKDKPSVLVLAMTIIAAAATTTTTITKLIALAECIMVVYWWNGIGMEFCLSSTVVEFLGSLV